MGAVMDRRCAPGGRLAAGRWRAATDQPCTDEHHGFLAAGAVLALRRWLPWSVSSPTFAKALKAVKSAQRVHHPNAVGRVALQPVRRHCAVAPVASTSWLYCSVKAAPLASMWTVLAAVSMCVTCVCGAPA